MSPPHFAARASLKVSHFYQIERLQYQPSPRHDMPNLTDLIQVIPLDITDEPEDIFASAPGLIFTNDTSILHGGLDSAIVYQSPRFGNIELKTTDPSAEDECQLFSHYLWNAGIRLAGLISDGEDANWSVDGETVLELGAGVGLVGIATTLAGAKSITISDYPAPVVLANIQRNAEKAIPPYLVSRYEIQGHIWGDLDCEFAQHRKRSFTRILAADCLWMPSQHLNLITSMLNFLTPDPAGRIFVVAGFHTGRAELADFFDIALQEGLAIEEIYEEDVQGFKMEWAKERDGGREDVTERKSWLVVARLKRLQ